MFSLREGDIIPGVGIGPVKLGADGSAFLSHLNGFKIRELPHYYLCIGGDIQVWVHKETNVIVQILACNNFCGKVMGEFGLGSFLSEIEKRLGETSYEELEAYMFHSMKGICFELKDIEEDWTSVEWFKAHAPIEYISVFLPEDRDTVLLP